MFSTGLWISLDKNRIFLIKTGFWQTLPVGDKPVEKAVKKLFCSVLVLPSSEVGFRLTKSVDGGKTAVQNAVGGLCE